MMCCDIVNPTEGNCYFVIHTMRLNTAHYSKYEKIKKEINYNNNTKFRSFKSKENIHKKEVGPYHGFGY